MTDELHLSSIEDRLGPERHFLIVTHVPVSLGEVSLTPVRRSVRRRFDPVSVEVGKRTSDSVQDGIDSRAGPSTVKSAHALLHSLEVGHRCGARSSDGSGGGGASDGGSDSRRSGNDGGEELGGRSIKRAELVLQLGVEKSEGKISTGPRGCTAHHRRRENTHSSGDPLLRSGDFGREKLSLEVFVLGFGEGLLLVRGQGSS
jgi:hypothetical protein